MTPNKIDLRAAVLQVLAGQSPGYAIYPNAAAFAAEGLDPAEVAETLDRLHLDGLVSCELVVVDEGEEDEALVPGGYRLLEEEEK